MCYLLWDKNLNFVFYNAWQTLIIQFYSLEVAEILHVKN